jgi:hypothetical protein
VSHSITSQRLPRTTATSRYHLAIEVPPARSARPIPEGASARLITMRWLLAQLLGARHAAGAAPEALDTIRTLPAIHRRGMALRAE